MISQLLRRIFRMDRDDDRVHAIKNQIQRDVAAIHREQIRARRNIKRTTAYKFYLSTRGGEG